MKNVILKQIDGGIEILKEIEITKKYGNDYRLERNRTKNINDRIHPKKLELIVSEIIETTKNAKTLRLVSKNGYLPPFQAGQYINVFVEINGVRTSRPYSISSSARQRAYYDITIASTANGFVSDYFLDKVQVGDSFEANGPAGNFYYNPIFHSKKQIFLAGGSGITPFMSMIREVLSSGLNREMHLIYGVRTPEAAFFKEELKQLASRHKNFTFTMVISNPEPNCKECTGLIDAKCIKELIDDYMNLTFYICGPQAMYDFCLNELEKLKIPKRQIRQEMFGSRQDIENEPGWPENLSVNQIFNVKVINGPTIKARAGESLLTALEKAGLRINVCCRSGQCSLCRVKLVSGKVFTPRGVLTRYADEKYGYIHSCKSFPMEDLEIML